jgi:hypothetical protein
VEWLVAVSIESAGQWLDGWVQRPALSIFAGAALANPISSRGHGKDAATEMAD